MKEYECLLNTIREGEIIEFGGRVYLAMATKLTYDWIITVVSKPIVTIASRSVPESDGVSLWK